MVRESGGCAAGTSGIGAGGGICCALTGSEVQIKSKKPKERLQDNGFLQMEVMA
jgi:hypothetical protein